MNLQPLRFAIVGSGSIADTHAAAIIATQGAQLVSVYSRRDESAQAFARAHGIQADASLEAVLKRPDVDVVCVTTPSGTHGDIAIRALSAGKHVLCEKPLEISTERIDALISAAERAERVLATVFQLRLTAGARRLKQAVEAGRFGRLALCSAYIKWWRDHAYYTNSPWKGTWQLDGGGALMNQAIHALDLLQWLAGMPCRVNAQTRTRTQPIEVEDTAAAVLEFPNGSLGVVEAATSCFPGMPMRIELAGDRGYAVLEDDRITKWQFAEPQPGDSCPAENGKPLIIGGKADPKAIGVEGHRAVVKDLVEAIRTGRQPAASGVAARNAVALIEAIHESGRTAASVIIKNRPAGKPDPRIARPAPATGEAS